MQTWGLAFLGIIALGSVVQAAFLVGLAMQGRRVAQRLDQLQERVDREIRPSLENLQRVTRNLADVSDLAVLQVRRFDGLLADTVEKVEETTTLMRKVILRPLGPLVDIAAFLKGIRRGLEVYQQLRGFDRHERAGARRYDDADDEHLFI
jgi:hypothetical protein